MRCLLKQAGPVGDLAPSVCWLNRRPPGNPPLPQVGSAQAPAQVFLLHSLMRSPTFALMAQESLDARWGYRMGENGTGTSWSSQFTIPMPFSLTSHEGSGISDGVSGPVASASYKKLVEMQISGPIPDLLSLPAIWAFASL